MQVIGQRDIDGLDLGIRQQRLIAVMPPEPRCKGLKAKKPRVVGLLLAAAATLAFGGVAVKYFLFPAPVQFPQVASVDVPTFRDQMAYFANQHFVLDEHTSDLNAAGSWLSARDYPVYTSIPVKITHFEGMGCKAIDWNGRRVGLSVS